MKGGEGLKLLIIRRDNIGDLVCVTPLLRALRERFPAARICALVNSYNRPVLENNPDVDEVFSYTKAKHRGRRQGLIGVHIDRIRLILRLRRERFDYAILAAPGYQGRTLSLVRLIRPRHIVGFVDAEKQRGSLTLPLLYPPATGLHEVEDVFRLLGPLGIAPGASPAVLVYPDVVEAGWARERLASFKDGSGLVLGVHISARKPSQRWPVDRFVELMRTLHARYDARFMLFWSPGDDQNPRHPGDDHKAAQIMAALENIPVLAYPTRRLPELIAGLSQCDVVICSDGGAMHLAAGLGKPIVCFFGQSDAARWHPWGVPYELLQPESRDVKDIGTAEAMEGFGRLMEKAKPAVFRK